jgi:hypothetical protein
LTEFVFVLVDCEELVGWVVLGGMLAVVELVVVVAPLPHPPTKTASAAATPRLRPIVIKNRSLPRP